MAKQLATVAARLGNEGRHAGIADQLSVLQHPGQFCLAGLDNLDRSIAINALGLLQSQFQFGTVSMVPTAFINHYANAGVGEVTLVTASGIIAEIHQKLTFDQQCTRLDAAVTQGDQSGIAKLATQYHVHRIAHEWMFPGQVVKILIGKRRTAIIGHRHAIFRQPRHLREHIVPGCDNPTVATPDFAVDAKTVVNPLHKVEYLEIQLTLH